MRLTIYACPKCGYVRASDEASECCWHHADTDPAFQPVEVVSWTLADEMAGLLDDAEPAAAPVPMKKQWWHRQSDVLQRFREMGRP